MTGLPPTLRDKRRYVLATVLPYGVAITQKDLYLSVHEAVTSLWGDTAASLIKPAVVAAERGHVIVRCRRGMERELVLALSTVVSCGGERVALRTIATSGTIESLRTRLSDLPEPVADAAAARADCRFDGREFIPVHCAGQKVDVIEKGFKNTTRFYLTTEDLEV
jgi:ribonuclease P/MRP protein subunit POP5